MRIVRTRNALVPARHAARCRAAPWQRSSSSVREDGDDAVLELTERFDHAELAPEQLRVDPKELEASVGVLEPDVLAGLRTAIANVRAVARAQVRDEPVTVELPEGHTVEVVERPVARAADLRARRAGRRTRPPS